MGNNVSKTGYLWQDPIHGQKKLVDVQDVQKSDGRSATPQFNTNGEHQGVTYSPGPRTITLKERKVTQPVIRWDLLADLQLQGELIEQEVGGAGEFGPRTVFRCAVSKVDEGNNTGDDNNRTIELAVTEVPTRVR